MVSRKINIATLSSDAALAVGQQAYIDIVALKTVPLYMQVVGPEYDIEFDLEIASGAPGNPILLPNNTSYTNFFNNFYTPASQQYGTNTITSNFGNGYALGAPYGPYKTKATIFTTTTRKAAIVTSCLMIYSQLWQQYAGSSLWVSTASTAGAYDTTTAHNSLGTVVFGTATTGRIIVTRKR